MHFMCNFFFIFIISCEPGNESLDTTIMPLVTLVTKKITFSMHFFNQVISVSVNTSRYRRILLYF